MPFIDIQWRNEPISLEYEWVGETDSTDVILVFLHEGLGSIAMWKDFPHQLCQELGLKGLVYSRPAYGKSTPRTHDVKWDVDFLHQQALEVFPEFIKELQITQPVHLLGHSDGGSIALLVAAHYPQLVDKVAVMAPHIFVEEKTIKSIAEAKVNYEEGSLKKGLSKYHDDVDSAFWGWNDIWLNPNFLTFNITSELAKISSSLLAIQGTDDPYGTMAQVKDIMRFVKHARVVEIPDCGHSPHRDSPIILSDTLKQFF
jgi:pimeloyl-ACP methyl ester carboxylesterase